MLEPGALVAGYRVERMLGDNSLAGTWLVRARDGSPAILRVLMFLQPAFQERFRRAAETIRMAAHPHLVRVLDVMEVEGLAACLVEHVGGGDLRRVIAGGPRPAEQVAALLHGILSGVSAAHELGLLHRNLKPSMVRLDDAGAAKVDDFALGKLTTSAEDEQRLTQMGSTFGTPQYMPPEQFRGAALVDARGDLFAVGCLAYELCAGKRAFDGTDVTRIYAASVRGQYPPLPSIRADLPDALVRLVDDLLRPDPEQRPPTARAALDRLEDELSALLPANRTLRVSAVGVPADYATPVAIDRAARVARPPPPEPERPRGRRVQPESVDIPYVLLGMAIATVLVVAFAAWLASVTPIPGTD